MPITEVHSFLVYPGKNEDEQPEISGARLPLRGKLFSMLASMFDDAHEECDIEIVFRAALDGQQQNLCRDLLTAYLADPGIDNGRAVAARLQSVTTHRSALGLLFLVAGTDTEGARLLLSRFPADQGVIAQEHARRLEVEFIERVFMKSAKAYKSAVYRASDRSVGFWDGRAVDKQITDGRELSNYWISEFLDSELRTTGAAGTRRLAIALRSAIRRTDEPAARDQLIAVAQLLPAQAGRVVSAERLARQFGLSPGAAHALASEMSRPELFRETFRFEVDEFIQQVAYRSVELDNGAILVGENARFDEIFEQERTHAHGGTVRYATEGHVVNQQLRKTR